MYKHTSSNNSQGRSKPSRRIGFGASACLLLFSPAAFASNAIEATPSSISAIPWVARVSSPTLANLLPVALREKLQGWQQPLILSQSSKRVSDLSVLRETLVVFSRNGVVGKQPEAPLIQASDGNFYGTTFGGGTLGIGTVFRMTPTGGVTTLVQFNYTNGAYPRAGLVQGSDGNFYGTTQLGGNSTACFAGCGTVFRITPAGALTTLVNFNVSNGSTPFAGLIQASDGNFYGTTRDGGSFNRGTVFRMTPSGTLKTLVNFEPDKNYQPYSGLIEASDGRFYGTTSRGNATDAGTVFRMTRQGTLTTLVNFNFTNGGDPRSGLVQGSDGNFYGTTYSGGSSTDCSGGCGTVFRMTPRGKLKTLVNFKITNGARPLGGLIQGSDGNFYGTTEQGGNRTCPGAGLGCGIVFQMTPSGARKTLIKGDYNNGAIFRASLIQANDGKFYGTSASGGETSCGDLCGTVFRMTVTP